MPDAGSPGAAARGADPAAVAPSAAPVISAGPHPPAGGATVSPAPLTPATVSTSMGASHTPSRAPPPSPLPTSPAPSLPPAAPSPDSSSSPESSLSLNSRGSFLPDSRSGVLPLSSLGTGPWVGNSSYISRSSVRPSAAQEGASYSTDLSVFRRQDYGEGDRGVIAVIRVLAGRRAGHLRRESVLVSSDIRSKGAKIRSRLLDSRTAIR